MDCAAAADWLVVLVEVRGQTNTLQSFRENGDRWRGLPNQQCRERRALLEILHHKPTLGDIERESQHARKRGSQQQSERNARRC